MRVIVPTEKPIHTVQMRELVEFILRGGDLGAKRLSCFRLPSVESVSRLCASDLQVGADAP
jgi:hypothetical protein